MGFSLKDLPTAALAVVLGAVVIGVGATVTSDLKADVDMSTNNTIGGASALGTYQNGTDGLANLGKKLPLIGTIIALAIVLGVVFMSLSFRR